MKKFKDFIAEAVDISTKAQFRSLAKEYEHHIRQAAGAPDEDDALEHAKEARKYLNRISKNHGQDKADMLEKGLRIRMDHEAKKAFDQ